MMIDSRLVGRDDRCMDLNEVDDIYSRLRYELDGDDLTTGYYRTVFGALYDDDT